jgi:phosphoribosylaminoimidazolecarboxamide formyltransferase/IMP cyclohydrolase
VAVIKNALLSVYDKQGIADLAKQLKERGVSLISSGGTQKLLEEKQISARKVEDLTGFPEILDGRVKTLHPKIFAGILATESPEHTNQLEKHQLERIHLVVVNLYPFEATIEREDCTLEEAIEKIDIGGPSLLRAAAKNFHSTTVITSPEQYQELIQEMEKNQGKTSLAFRHKCAIKAFQHVARYNSIIARYLAFQSDADEVFPSEITLQGKKIQDLRYGENPHQQAAFYVSQGKKPLNNFEKLHGKELSYNNILDLDAAFSMVREFIEPVTVIIKHNNPCGAASDNILFNSYEKALATDSLSAFGGIVGFNRPVDGKLAEKMSKHFFECILAPHFETDAIDILSKKKNLRLITFDQKDNSKQLFKLRTVQGGFLVQTEDDLIQDVPKAQVVTKRTPTSSEWKGLEFVWRLVKHVHSNAIIFAGDSQLIGVGAGQMSRVDAAQLAITKAQNAEHKTQGTVVASDAFFPFRDGIEVIAQAGATAVIQPGGSIRDTEVIEAADEFNLAMVFTGNRHFKH